MITMHLRIMPDGPVADGFVSMTVPSPREELDRCTILAADSAEELEALLAGGYPTPGIRAVLEDESIPLEDRYWLDCRIRSAVAQILHRFYDKSGNAVELDAEWILPGELYWHEMMIMHPLGAAEGLLTGGPSFDFPVKAGELRNLFGEHVGNLAAVNRFVRLSRDGSISVMRTGSRSRMSGGDMYFCFLNLDGGFSEIEMYPDERVLSDLNMAVSQDGSISAWHVYRTQEPQTSHLLVFDREGNEIERYELPEVSISQMAISGDNRYIACSGGVYSGSGIVDRQTGEVMWFSHGTSRSPFFSDNSRFCVLNEGGYQGWCTEVVDLQERSHFRIQNDIAVFQPAPGMGNSSISNDGRVLVINNNVYLDGNNILRSENPSLRWNSISPNGFFTLFHNGTLTGSTRSDLPRSFEFFDLGTLAGR
jgi:hypothetical protein